MRKRHFAFFMLLFCGILPTFSPEFLFAMSKSGHAKKSAKICVHENCITVETAMTAESRQKGLMYRKSLSENGGLLMVYPENQYLSIWMKNMNFDLDLLWIDEEGSVVWLEKNVPACREKNCPSYEPGKRSRYVLEIPSGRADAFKIGVGDKVEILWDEKEKLDA